MKDVTNIMALEFAPLSSSWDTLMTSSIKSVTEHHIRLSQIQGFGKRGSLHFQLQGAHCIFIYHVWTKSEVLEFWTGVLDCVLEL